MISEQELATLSYPDAPNMVTDKVPGPKTQKLLEDSSKYESMVRGAGSFPCVYDEGLRGNCVSYFTQGGSGALETAI